jgi:hypothetical protein
LNLNKKIFFFISLSVLLPLGSTFASPSKITFVFLSEVTAQVLYDALDKLNSGQEYSLTAEGFPKNCVPMGDGCFHPQLGFIEASGMEKKPIVEKKPKDFKLKTINSDATSSVKCDDGNYFDIYCGKSNKKVESHDYEVWIDISTSMRRMDYSKDEGKSCQLQNFALKLKRDCKKGVTIKAFNTSIKVLSDTSEICNYRGLNNVKKLTRWIDNSNAKQVLIITDINELTTDLQNYLDTVSAKIYGVGTTPFQVSQLLEDDLFKTLTKQCR